MSESIAALAQKSRALRQESKRIFTDFLLTEVEVASTFASAAVAEGNNAAKRKRNQQSARKAYDAVQYFLKRVEISESAKAQITPRLRQLKSTLRKAGEQF